MNCNKLLCSRKNSVNFKLIAIFSLTYFLLGILQGIPEGVWMAKTGELLPSFWYQCGKYIPRAVIDLVFFYALFMKASVKPILHALSVVVLAWIVNASIVYFLAGLTPSVLVTLLNGMVTVFCIIISYSLVIKLNQQKNA